MTAMPKTTALIGWYGSNRMLAAQVGRELDGCDFVAVPFAGGMSELLHIKARSMLVNDKHAHAINLARVAGDKKLGPKLYRYLRRMPFHPVALLAAQSRCVEREATGKDPHAGTGLFAAPAARDDSPDLEWAVDYFVSAWMGRGGNSGKGGEFKGGLSLRYDAGGGDSCVRFRSAASGLPVWRRDVLGRCNFTCEDFRDLLARVADKDGNGIYSDAPWPDAGDQYKHRFTYEDHVDLARILSTYKQTRVVVRFGIHPTIEKLYPRDKWTYREQTSRSSANGGVAEALIMNGPSRAGKMDNR